LGGTSIGLGVVGAIVMFFVLLFAFFQRVDGFQRISSPDTTQIQLEAGSYTIFHEATPGSGTTTNQVRFISFDPCSCAAHVVAPDGNAVRVSSYVGSFSYSTPNGHTGRALGTFRAEQAGTYEIASSLSGRLAIGQGAGGAFAAAFIVPGLIFVLLGGAGAIMLIVTAVKRRGPAEWQPAPAWSVPSGGAMQPWGSAPQLPAPQLPAPQLPAPPSWWVEPSPNGWVPDSPSPSGWSSPPPSGWSSPPPSGWSSPPPSGWSDPSPSHGQRQNASGWPASPPN
jgi:hypothetical protein